MVVILNTFLYNESNLWRGHETVKAANVLSVASMTSVFKQEDL